MSAHQLARSFTGGFDLIYSQTMAFAPILRKRHAECLSRFVGLPIPKPGIAALSTLTTAARTESGNPGKVECLLADFPD